MGNDGREGAHARVGRSGARGGRVGPLSSGSAGRAQHVGPEQAWGAAPRGMAARLFWGSQQH